MYNRQISQKVVGDMKKRKTPYPGQQRSEMEQEIKCN